MDAQITLPPSIASKRQLPAISSRTAATGASATISSPLSRGSGFIDGQGSPLEVFAVIGFDDFVGVFLRSHFHKGKPFGSARMPIEHNITPYHAPCLLKEIPASAGALTRATLRLLRRSRLSRGLKWGRRCVGRRQRRCLSLDTRRVLDEIGLRTLGGRSAAFLVAAKEQVGATMGTARLDQPDLTLGDDASLALAAWTLPFVLHPD